MQGTRTAHEKHRSNVSPELRALVEEFETHRASGTQDAFRPKSAYLQVRSERVVIDCAARDDAAKLAADLEALGMTDVATYGRAVGGWLPIEAIPRLEELDSLQSAKAAMAMTHR